MAYDPNQDQQNQQNQTQNPAIQPMTSSAPGAGPGASTGKAATPQSAPAQPFQNLQAYLTANAPQVQTQANQIAGNLNNQYGQVQGDINKAQSDFGEQVKGGYAQANQGLTNEAAADPSAFVSNPGNVKAFQSLYNDTYAGPSSFESGDQYGNLSNEVQHAASNATAFTSLPGIQNYFQGQNPNATQGGNTLDAVLFSGNPQAYKSVQDAAKPFADLNGYLSTAATSANQGVSKAQQDASNISSGLQNQFNGEKGIIPTFESDVNNRLDTTRSNASASADKLMSDFLNGGSATPQPTLTPEDYQALGLSPNEMESIISSANSLRKDYNAPVNLASTLTRQDPNVVFANANSVATPDDYQKAAALSQLTGNDLTSFLNPSLANKPGTATPGLINFNKSGAQAETSGALRTNDLNFINSLPNNTGKDIMTVLQTATPQQLNAFKANMSTDEKTKFDDVLGRLGFAPGQTPTQPISTNPNDPIGYRSGLPGIV